MPRWSGSTQKISGSSALSAIGKMPAAYARSSNSGVSAIIRAMMPASARLRYEPLEPMDIVVAVDKVGFSDHAQVERKGCLDPRDHEFLERAAEPHEAFIARR